MPRPQHAPKKSTTKTNIKAGTPSAHQRAELLTIPLELRQEIYSHLVHDSYPSLLKILVVNQRLSGEVKPFLYKRPFFFDGQSQIYDWLVIHQTSISHFKNSVLATKAIKNRQRILSEKSSLEALHFKFRDGSALLKFLIHTPSIESTP